MEGNRNGLLNPRAPERRRSFSSLALDLISASTLLWIHQDALNVLREEQAAPEQPPKWKDPGLRRNLTFFSKELEVLLPKHKSAWPRSPKTVA